MSSLKQQKHRLYLSQLEARIAPAADFAQVRSTPENYAIDRIIVKTDQTTIDLGDIGSVATSLGNGFYSIRLASNISVIDALNFYSKQDDVLAGPDQILSIQKTPNDPSYSTLWGLPKIDAPTVWNVSTGSSSIIVAVIDSGVDYNHPDLAANMWKNPGEIAGNGIDDDNNGYVDDVYGYDFAANDANPMDIGGHGTHVAGTIGAVGDNGIGVAGVNWNVKIMALRFIGDDGIGFTSNAIRSLNYAVAMGAKISNNSYGGEQSSSSFSLAIEAAKSKGHIFVTSAGNGGSDNIGDNNDIVPYYPTNYTRTNIISVAATDSSDNLATFSNYGATLVDLAAPGVNIYSTLPNNSYGYYSGTSMAAPHVAGAAALIWSIHPTWTYDQVIEAILDSVDKKSNLNGKMTTGGRLNIFKATSLNQAPIAANDSYSTNEDTPLTINAPGILTNDTDSNNDTLTANLVSGPSHGTLTLNSNGSFIYTPNSNYFGTDSFTYRVFDGQSYSNTAAVSLNVVSVNDPPQANNDTYSINEDNTLNNNVLLNDSDIEGSTLTAILVNGPSHGTLALHQNGSFTYTPDANYFGADSFSYKAFDGLDYSNISTASITILPINDPPIGNNDSYVINEDTTLNAATVLSNDTDIEGTPLTAILASGPSNGNLTFNANGTFTYTPHANYFGTDSFTYKAFDGSAFSNSTTATITINPVNDPPIASNDSYIIDEDTTLNNNVLFNDVDIESTSLTAEMLSGTNHGTITLNSNGTFSYTPNSNYSGNDSFTYRASDGQAFSNTATVTITINPVNDAPITNNDSYSIDEDNTLTGSSVLLNDIDIEGSSLSATLITGPSHGTLTFHANGTFTYTPITNYFGTDSFTYKASDGTLTSNIAIAAITINPINDAPLAIDDTFTIDEDTTINNNVLSNDLDIESNTLTALLVNNVSHGTLILNSNGTFTYNPNANYFGSDTFTYKAFDGNNYSDIASVTITINPINDPPVAINDSFSIDEDSILNGSSVLENDSDVETSSLTAHLITTPLHGSMTFHSNGSFTYIPEPNFFGADTFTYTASDGSIASNLATVTISVRSVNDAPNAANDAYTLDEDTISDGNILSNDSDIDSPLLSALLVTGPLHGTLNLNSNGTFSYVPDLNYFGSDSFTYKAFDGIDNSNIATVNLSINPINDAPVAANDSFSINEDTILSDNVLSNDTDVDHTTLTASLANDPTNGSVTLNSNGSFIYTPNTNYFGSDSFTYTASDGSASSPPATVFISINSINDPPTANNDSYSTSEDISTSGNVLANDIDIDDLLLTATLMTNVQHGSLTWNSDGNFTYFPNLNYFGNDSFTYRISDGKSNSGIATVNFTISPVNDPPSAVADAFSLDEDTSLIGNVLANDSDVEGTSLAATLINLPTHGNLTFNSNGLFTYLPFANYFGTDSFTYKAFDGSAYSPPTMVHIEIMPINDSPLTETDFFAIDEDQTLIGNVLNNDSDPENTLLTAIITTNPSHGTVVLNQDGSFNYQPAPNYFGSDSFSYLASDGISQSSPTAVTITINPINDPPIASADFYSINEDTTLNAYSVLLNDFDVENTPLSALLISEPIHGHLTWNPTGTFTYVPNPNYYGTDTFTYQAFDGLSKSPLTTATIYINSINDPPFAISDHYNINEDQATYGNVAENDSDIDSYHLIYSLQNGPSHGSLVLLNDGNFTYIPHANYYGSDSFTYKVSDGESDSLATVTFQIASINDPPSPTDDFAVVNDGKSVLINVLANDRDVDNNFTLTSFTQPIRGRVVRERNSLRFHAPLNSSGQVTFSYSVTDSLGLSSTATVFVDIKDVTKPKLQTARLFYGSNSFVDLRSLSRTILPWNTINRIEFAFSENMQVNADDLQISTSAGTLIPTTFHYDPTRFTATWTFNQSLDGLRLTMRLRGKGSDGVKDLGNNPIGTDWTKNLAFLAGDYNGDGVVNKADWSSIKALFNRNPAKAKRWADVDGNGIVDALDLAIAKNKIITRLKK